MREEGNVRGLNTAATLWASAAVGACAGADLILEALLGTLFVLAANTLLRPIVNNINRQPLDVISSEVTYMVYVIARRHQQKAVLALLEAELSAAITRPGIWMCMPLVRMKSKLKARWLQPLWTGMSWMR